MKRKLSSDLTPLYKSLWIFFAIGILIMLLVPGMPISGKVIYSICWAIGALLFWVIYDDLQTVVIDSQFMYVSSGRSMTIIPFSEINSVRQEILDFRHPVIVVELKHKTSLGSEIKFMPYWVFKLIFTKHPVVNELKHLANLPIN